MSELQSTYSAATQSLGLEGIGNARELGGYRTADGRAVRRGAILRTAAPEGATERDRERLERDLRLSCVLDLRMNMERRTLDEDARGLDFAQTHRIGILDEDYLVRMCKDVPPEQMQKLTIFQMIVMGVDMGVVDDHMYVDFLEAERGKRGYTEVFSYLLAQPEGEALLFHCTQGKDRTGLAAMLILSALGVDEETIVFDYLLTNTFNAKLIERERQGLLASGIPAERIESYMIGFDEVFPQTMENAIDHLKRAYGSVWGYVEGELGISERDRVDLCAKYLASRA